MSLRAHGCVPFGSAGCNGAFFFIRKCICIKKANAYMSDSSIDTRVHVCVDVVVHTAVVSVCERVAMFSSSVCARALL